MEKDNSAFSNFLLDVDGFIKGKEDGFKIQSLNQKFSNERDFTNALITEVLLEGGFHQIIHDFYIFHELLSEILGENISLKSGHEGVGNKSMSKEDKKKVHKINNLMKPFLNDIMKLYRFYKDEDVLRGGSDSDMGLVRTPLADPVPESESDDGSGKRGKELIPHGNTPETPFEYSKGWTPIRKVRATVSTIQIVGGIGICCCLCSQLQQAAAVVTMAKDFTIQVSEMFPKEDMLFCDHPRAPKDLWGSPTDCYPRTGSWSEQLWSAGQIAKSPLVIAGEAVNLIGMASATGFGLLGTYLFLNMMFIPTFDFFIRQPLAQLENVENKARGWVHPGAEASPQEYEEMMENRKTRERLEGIFKGRSAGRSRSRSRSRRRSRRSRGRRSRGRRSRGEQRLPDRGSPPRPLSPPPAPPPQALPAPGQGSEVSSGVNKLDGGGRKNCSQRKPRKNRSQRKPRKNRSQRKSRKNRSQRKPRKNRSQRK